MEHSLILYHQNQQIFTSDEHWLYPLFELEEFLNKSEIPRDQLLLNDKIAGKAAACLIVRMGIKHCFIDLISERAIPVFEKSGIQYSFGKMVEHIQCRTEDLITDTMSIDDTYLFLRKRAGKIQGVSLKVENLSVLVSGKKLLDGFSLELGRGEQMVLMGDNGAGKTTLLRTILGFVQPESGTIEIGGFLVGSKEWEKARDDSGYLLQENFHHHQFPISASEVVSIGLSSQNITVEERSFRIELAMRRTNSFHLSDKPFFSLSGGEKQKVSLARCLCQNAKLILLDEPTASLDDKGKDELLSLLQELSKNEVPTMLLVSHDIKWIDQLGWSCKILRNGKLC